MRPTISLDPEGRMAAVRVFTSYLALLPLDEDESAGEKQSTASSVINFALQIDSRLKVVRTLTFLPGFLNPTVAILYDRGSNEGESDKTDLTLRTVLNHCDETHKKETCALMIVAIEPVKYSKSRASSRISSGNFQYTVVNCIEGIPFDAEGLHPLPKPVGGLFISCTNLLLWCDISSSTAPYSIALNQFAPLTYAGRISITQFQSVQLTSLLDCRFLALGAVQSGGSNVLKCLLVTKHGERLVISIARTGRTLGFFNIEVLTEGAKIAASPSDLVLWNERTIFVGSEGGCSQLISIYSAAVSSKSKSIDIVPDVTHTTHPVITSTKALPAGDDIDAFLYGEDVEMTSAPEVATKPSPKVPDDDYLKSLEKEELALASTEGSRTATSKSSSFGPLKFELLDELESLGPMIDLAIGDSAASAEGVSEFVSIGGAFTHRTTGQFFGGSVNVLSQRISPSVQLSFSLPDTRTIWTLNERNRETKFLVASTISSTLVLTTSQARITELEESDFYLEGPTLFCGVISCENGSPAILQIFPTGIKLLTLDRARLIRDCRADLSGTVCASVLGNSFYCLGSDKTLKQFSSETLQCTQTFQGVSAFTTTTDNLLVAFESGSLSIYNGTQLVFENAYFSRLPVTLSNTLSQETQSPQMELLQKIISLNVIGKNDNAISLLVVRYECKGVLGIATYRLGSALLQRIDSQCLGMSHGQSLLQPACVNLENEAILYFVAPKAMPVVSLGLTDRNYPRQHVLLANDAADSHVLSVAAYNQTSLMVLDSRGFVSIIDLDRSRRKYSLDWQSGWYLQSIGLPDQLIPTHVVYHPTSRTYLIASAPPSSDFTLPVDEYAPISDNTTAIAAYEGPVAKLFATNSTTLHLLNPLSWTVVDSTTEHFLPYEGVTCMRSLDLETRQTASGFAPFITIGTAYQKGEDRPIRGRALVFDIAEVVPEPGKPETNRKLRLKGITDFKGPVMAFTPLLQGNVAISAGAKVIVNTFEEDEKFAGVAFHDIGTCTLALASLKSFFATGDLVKSVAFFAFQAEPLARIHELGRDFGQNLQTTAIEFLVNSKGQTLLVTSDDQGGLHFFCYAPNSKLSYLYYILTLFLLSLCIHLLLLVSLDLTTNAGQRLLDKGSFYLHGAPVNRLLRIPFRGDFGVVAAGQDGSVHLLAPVEDSVAFRRLFVLEMRLGTLLPASGGLNPRIMRQVPRRMNVTHTLPATSGQFTVSVPTSAIKTTENHHNHTDDHHQETSTNNNGTLNSTLILHHLPVSNAVIDSSAIKRFIADPLCDGLARQIFANRFGLEFENLMRDIAQIYINSL
jgi:hypothetical protein